MVEQRDLNGAEVLEAEHQQLVELFNRVSGPEEDRPAALKEALKSLGNHVAAEKQMVIPALKDHTGDNEGFVAQLAESHDQVERTMTLIERRKVNSPDMPDLVNDLVHTLETHVAAANDNLLPFLREKMSPEQLDELGERLVSEDRRRATHSHPILPHSGPLAAAAAKTAEMIDGFRDDSPDLGRGSS